MYTGTILGWVGYVKVDGKTFKFLGNDGKVPVDQAVQKNLQITSTQSTFTLTAGSVDLTVNFLSPVEPDNLVNHSFPFSYLAVTATSNDGQSHSVQVYTDISAEWVTGNVSQIVSWSTSAGDMITHQAQLVDQTPFVEVGDRIQYGSVYYATSNTQGTTYQSGEDEVVRSQFVNNTTLLNTQDTQFRAVSDRWPVFGMAHDLGQVSSTSAPVVWSVGHVRDPAVEYIVQGGFQNRSLYFWSQYLNISDAISAFHDDYPPALMRANSFDQQVKRDAQAISNDYADLVALSIRQSFAASEITISKNGDGIFDTSDVLMFLKEISSDGDVSTVDVIFPTWPLYLYTSPALGKYTLLPLFEYQATGQYSNQWSIHDLGDRSYPKAVGHNDGKDEAMPVEECGNMLIMTLSYTQRTGDKSLISTYYSLLDQWAQFLITDSLIPANQLSTDNFARSLTNQTNLAIKGIIGIKAMSEIASLMGDGARSSNYSSIASSYVDQFMGLAMSSDSKHLTLNYGNETSWGLSYNLYADKLLGTNLFPDSLYQTQTSWYSNLVNEFGLPLDTRNTFTLSGWEIWTAAIVKSTSLRDHLIFSVHQYAANGNSDRPFTDWYDTKDGKSILFTARPVVGAHLAFLVLSNATDTTTTGSSSATPLGPTSGGGSSGSTGGSNNNNEGGSNSAANRVMASWFTLSIPFAFVVLGNMVMFAS
ncbi:unnamed protein product [Somion occarium]|uniref:DUF1793-domain-containing protein n=1 Tax=Somion occarium TaxID=3059160 RepID=A0ABP1CVS7_9APHY